MLHFSRTKHSLPGFTLIEIAIVMCIMGVLSGLGLPLLNQYIKQKRAQMSEDHLEKVMHSLATFVVIHKRLPCPADPAASPSEKGIEQESCSYKKAFRGIIPYRSLGIPEKIAKDGYHNWMTYAVNLDLTSLELKHLSTPDDTVPPTAVFCEVKKGDNELNVKNSDHVSVVDSSSDIIAFVLISHGQSGKQPSISGPDKTNNATSDQTFIDKPISLSKEDYFDDVVKWVTRDNLMAFYGRTPCHREKTAS